jgi:NAD-dependent deacetylase
MVRPHIVWFGEALDPRSLNMALERSVAADVFIVAGTPGAVHPAASLAGYAKRNGGIIIEINLEPTSLSHDADITLFGPSSSALSALVTAIKKTRH